MDYKYDGIGFNGPHLAKMDFPQFKKEVSHHFEGSDADAKMQDLHGKMKAKFLPQPAKADPVPVAKS